MAEIGWQEFFIPECLRDARCVGLEEFLLVGSANTGSKRAHQTNPNASAGHRTIVSKTISFVFNNIA